MNKELCWSCFGYGTVGAQARRSECLKLFAWKAAVSGASPATLWMGLLGWWGHAVGVPERLPGVQGVRNGPPVAVLSGAGAPGVASGSGAWRVGGVPQMQLASPLLTL